MSMINDVISEFADQMKCTPQSDRWHKEGDVLAHTEMVVDALDAHPEFWEVPDGQKVILSCAAWLHDIGKIKQTRIVDGEIKAPHHATVGSRMAREALWLKGLCGEREKMLLREAIALLIRYHSFPPHAIEITDARIRLHSIASNGLIVPDFSMKLLCMLSRADMLGHICEDKDEMLLNISLCEELAKVEHCFDEPFQFPSSYVRRKFLDRKDVWKHQLLFDDTWGTVYLMSGLPGTGKDTWIQKNLPDIPMISLDKIRREHKISPMKNQGLVANLAKEQAKEYLRTHQSFVWNATNITQTMRQQLIALFESYKANVHIIYLETDWQTLLERNASREDAVPQSAIETMLGKLELPEIHEAAQVDWISV